MNAYDVTVTATGTATVTIPLCASGYDSEVFYATKDIDFGEFSIRKRETIGIEEKETYALASVRITGQAFIRNLRAQDTESAKAKIRYRVAEGGIGTGIFPRQNVEVRKISCRLVSTRRRFRKRS